MNGSFYTAALGASGQQGKIDVIANNIANVNTTAFKAKNSTFTNLLYRNMDRGAGGIRLQGGVGVKLNTIATDFTATGFAETGREYDYAIQGNGFFMLQDPATGEITYTRNGHFSLSETEDGMFLVSDTGKRVLDRDQEAVRVDIRLESRDEDEDDEDEDDDEDEEDVDLTRNPLRIGVFDFRVREGMESVGSTEFVPTETNGGPVLLQRSNLVNGALEQSGVDFAKEMAKLVETQRAFSYALKMLQTSDEVENMINTLR